MNDFNRIIIPLSQVKITLSLLGSISFVIIGILFALNPDKYVTIIFGSEEIIRIAGIVSFLFFGIIGIFILKKLFNKKAGLVIDENGIYDNSSGISIGLIKWENIVDIKILKLSRQRIIKIIVSNPNEYIEKQENKFQRRIMKLNYEKFETPIQITANSLQCSFNELYELIKVNFEKYKNKK